MSKRAASPGAAAAMAALVAFVIYAANDYRKFSRQLGTYRRYKMIACGIILERARNGVYDHLTSDQEAMLAAMTSDTEFERIRLMTERENRRGAQA